MALVLDIDTQSIALQEGINLTSQQMPGLSAAFPQGIVARIERRSDLGNALAIANVSQTVWKIKLPLGERFELIPGAASTRLVPGMTIDYGAKTASVSDSQFPPPPSTPLRRGFSFKGPAIVAGAVLAATIWAWFHGTNPELHSQIKQCSDGTIIPSSHDCPLPKMVQCGDGTTVQAGVQCPVKSCPDGSVIGSARNCPATIQCPDGSHAVSAAACPRENPPAPPTKQCADGTIILSSQDCPLPKPVQCADGTTVAAGTRCPVKTCSDGSEVGAGQACPTTVQCPDGSLVATGTRCMKQRCPGGELIPSGDTCPPVRKSCPDGSTVLWTTDCPKLKVPVPHGQIIGTVKIILGANALLLDGVHTEGNEATVRDGVMVPIYGLSVKYNDSPAIKERISSLLGGPGSSLTCNPRGKQPDSQATAYECFAAGRNFATRVLANGLAETLPGDPASYIRAEKQAQRAGAGLWASRAVP